MLHCLSQVGGKQHKVIARFISRSRFLTTTTEIANEEFKGNGTISAKVLGNDGRLAILQPSTQEKTIYPVFTKTGNHVLILSRKSPTQQREVKIKFIFCRQKMTHHKDLFNLYFALLFQSIYRDKTIQRISSVTIVKDFSSGKSKSLTTKHNQYFHFLQTLFFS